MQNKRKNKAPSFHMYAGDFLSDMNVRLMTMAQRGMYITLLLHEWIEGSLPSSLPHLRILCDNHPDFDSDWKEISHCFYDEDGRTYNSRLEKERKQMNEYRDRQSDSGKMGAKARWNKKNGTAIAPPSNKEVEIEVEIEVENKIKTKKLKKKKNDYTDEFENEFWSIYPRRDSKKRAMEKYISTRDSGVSLEKIISGLKSYIKHWRASGTEPSYIPMATTWLNQERYDDELLNKNNSAKALVLNKTFNFMCDSCGIEKKTDRELTTSEKVCECGEGFFYTKSSIQHERNIVNSKAVAKSKGIESPNSSEDTNIDSNDFSNQFNNLVNSLGVR